MNHTIAERTLTDAERKLVKRSGPGYGSIFLLPVIPGGGILILGLFAAAAVVWLLEKLGLPLGQAGRMWFLAIGGILGGLFGLAGTWCLFRSMLRARQEAKLGLERAKVEVLTIQNPQVVQQEEYNDEGPIYYMDIGQGKLLFVCGQWMFDQSTYRALSEFGKEDNDDENWPPFPCAEFVLYRVSESGKVLQIEIKGAKLSPVRTIKRKEVPLTHIAESMIIDGSLDDLKRAMAGAKRRRKRGDSASV